MSGAKTFYDREYEGAEYAVASEAETHGCFKGLSDFINGFGLRDRKCLEVGCGRGIFQDMVRDYTGVDLADSVGAYLHKPFMQCDAANLPFSDNTFDALWSITVLEHVPEPEKALLEMCRVVKPEGLIFLAPAWQCRTWARDGYPVRPYSDFNLAGKVIKASIPIRNSIVYRSLYIMPVRLIRLIAFFVKRRPVALHYRKLKPNYDEYWMSDSDACSSLDPFEVLLWFFSRGHRCLTYETLLKQVFVRTGPVIFRVIK